MNTIIINQEQIPIDSNDKNYDIYIHKIEFDSIIFSLNTLITDIKNNQQKPYLISQIQQIITKLKNLDNPPAIRLNQLPTFKTVDFRNLNNDQEDNIGTPPIISNLNEMGIDVKIYSSNYISDNQDNNNPYEGDMVNGKKEGKGKYKFKNGCIYEGYFKNDKREGNGIFYYANGDRYKGQFKDDNYQGNGIFYYHNGDRYEGEFNKNKYEGNGKYFYHHGDKFEGLWKNDQKNGKGTYIYLNGDKITGNYQNGKPIGIHTKISSDGKVTQIKCS